MKIEKGLPRPVMRERRRYPYREMELGDSFWVAEIGLQVMMNTNYRWGKRLGRRFVARAEGGGVRVWRIE